MSESELLQTDADGVTRCWWPGDDPQYVAYHDDEWGQPVADDHRLFEKLCLEGFQAGLSWLTILRKRENFRAAFCEFDYEQVAQFGGQDVERLLADAGIVRHRGKIEATINNARRALELVEEWGSVGAFIWSFEPRGVAAEEATWKEGEAIPSTSVESTALSKDLKRRGWRFVGPTTMYAFMQAMGLVNDHVEGCEHRPVVEQLRLGFTRPPRTKKLRG